jgi:hypothetical protein
MQRKYTLLSGVALGAIASLGLIVSADAKPVKHHHQLAAKVAVADDRVAALTSEVETLESRLTAESLAREQMQAQVQAAQAQAQQAQADAQSAHTQLAEQIQTIPGQVKADVDAVKPKPTWADNTKVGATVYTDLSNISQSPSPNAKNGTGFDVKRAYLTVEHSFNSVYSANLTADFAPGASSFTNGGTIVGAETIKYAFVQAAYDPAFIVQAGAAKTPWIPFVEDLYGYRYIDKVIIDQNKFGNSSDWGVNAHGDFGKGLLDYSVSVLDGNGYKSPDRSQTMDVEGRVNLNWNGFVAAVGGYTGKLSQDFQGVATPVHNVDREDALVAYVAGPIRIGAEWFQANDWKVVTKAVSDKSDGESIFGSYNFTPQWALFGRYDWENPSKDIDSAEKYTYANIGISYEPVKTVDIALVYKHESISHAPTTGAAASALGVGYTDGTTTLGNATHPNAKYDEVGVFTQFKF